MRLHLLPFLFAVLPLCAQSLPKQAPLTSAEERAALHSGPDWEAIAAHLPDPQTTSAAQLELEGDVLRVRRFPEDALDYYGYAMARGGNVSDLLNKMGIVRLELRQTELAHAMFQQTVRAQKRNASAWNNLGVTEYVMKNYRGAVADYKKASKLDKQSAVYHSNMAMAYFGQHDMDSTRKEFAKAIHLDPNILHGHDSGGTTAHVLGTQNYGELCFEMARLYARENKPADAIQWLAKSGENGYPVREALRGDFYLSAYSKNPDVRIMLDNVDGLHGKRAVAVTNLPSLGTGNSEH